MTTKQTQQTRARLLEAAANIVTTRGSSHLTLDNVAQEAGVSKGGLLHHFRSKEALIKGLIEKLATEFDRQLALELEKEPPGKPGRWLRAYIRANFAPQFLNLDITAAINLAIVADPEMLGMARQSFIEAQQQAENDGLAPAKGTLIRMAVDGFMFSEVLGMAPVAEPLRTQLFNELMKLTEM